MVKKREILIKIQHIIMEIFEINDALLFQIVF